MMSRSEEFSEERDLILPDARKARRSGISSARSDLLKIGTLTLAGIALPLLLENAVPQKFQADVYLNVMSADGASIDQAVKSLHSRPSLDNLIRAFNLSQGSDFAVDRSGVTRVLYDIVSGGGMTVAEAEAELRKRLSQAITVNYDQARSTVRIAVTAGEADEAKRLVGMLSSTFADGVAMAANPDPAVDGLRQALERADAALSGFVSQTGEDKVSELRRVRSEAQSLAGEIARAAAETAALHQKFVQASAMKLADVLGRPLPDSLEFTGLEYQRQRHVEAKLAVDQLSSDLGPRHPRLLAAQGALDQVRADIQNALKQLVVSLQREEAAAARQLSELKARQGKVSSDTTVAEAAQRLTALEAAVDEARENYLQGKQHRPDAKIAAVPAKVQVLKPASVKAAAATGPSLLEMCGRSGVAGFVLGLVLVCFGRLRRAGAKADDTTAMVEELALADISSIGIAPKSAPVPVLMPQAVDFDEDDWATEEPMDDEPAFESPAPVRYPVPANDMPLADHIRDLLMAKRRPVAEAAVPPLVAAVMAGGAYSNESIRYGARHASAAPSQSTQELVDLRRDMADLREKVKSYSERRQVSSR
jgi:hypothetical protein